MFAFVLVNTCPAMERKVESEIRSMPGIQEVSILSGEFDLILKVEMEENEFSEFITKIRQIKGVADTKVLSGIRY